MTKEMFNRTIPQHFLRFVPNRDEHIIELCRQKRVLHIGASDWPLTKQRWARGDLLYVRISKVAIKQLGIDLIKEGSDFLNEKNIPNSEILTRDMNELQELDFLPDIIIFGETLEHLMNLEAALSSLKKVMREDTLLLISVPNAFYFMNFAYALVRKEHQHPDHSVAFTYKTLTQLLAKNDLTVQEFCFTFLEASLDPRTLNWKGRVALVLMRMMTRISPVFAETLMAVAKK